MPRKSSAASSSRKREVAQPPILMERTQPVIERLSALLGEPVFTYWNSTKGAICQNDVAGLYALVRSTGKLERLSLFIKSDGGSGQAALRMVNLLRRYVKHLTVLAPLECQSAATMLALGADRIIMGPLAHLSAVDTSLTHDLSPIDRDNDRVSVSNDELLRVIRLWTEQAKDSTKNPYEALFPYVHPLVIGAVDRSSALSTRICEEILSYHMTDKAAAREISNVLNSGYPSHNYPITLREAKRIGLNVEPMEDCVNGLLFELNEIYLFPIGQGLALPRRRTPLGGVKRQEQLAPRRDRKGQGRDLATARPVSFEFRFHFIVRSCEWSVRSIGLHLAARN